MIWLDLADTPDDVEEIWVGDVLIVMGLRDD